MASELTPHDLSGSSPQKRVVVLWRLPELWSEARLIRDDCPDEEHCRNVNPATYMHIEGGRREMLNANVTYKIFHPSALVSRFNDVLIKSASASPRRNRYDIALVNDLEYALVVVLANLATQSRQLRSHTQRY